MNAEELATQMIFAYAESSPETGDGFTPYASAFLAMREALEEVSEMAVSWQPLTPGDIAEVRVALAQADALLDPKGGERG